MKFERVRAGQLRIVIEDMWVFGATPSPLFEGNLIVIGRSLKSTDPRMHCIMTHHGIKKAYTTDIAIDTRLV